MVTAPMRRAALFAAIALPSAAHAEVDPSRCSAVDVDAAWTAGLFADMSGDTGYFPQGFAAQLRITGNLGAESNVASSVQAKACWDNGKITLAVDGKPGTGWMDVNYGAQVQVFAKIDTTILGQRIFWEGQIPLPLIPDDLRIAAGGTFDPKVTGAWYVSDATDPVSLLSTDLIGDLIGIIGISGGLRITATASMQTTYSMTDVAAGTASGVGPFELARPSSGYGAALDVPLSIDGTMHYAPALRFGVRFDVKILGVRVVDYELFGVDTNLPAIDRQISLTSDGAHIALPVLDGIGEGARIDFASAATQALLVRNRGERELVIAIAKAPTGVTTDAATITIPAGGDAQLRVTAADLNQVASGGTLVLATNDPDHATLEVALGADIGGTDPGMVDEPGKEGGCNSGGAEGWAPIVLVLVALGLRRSLAPCLRRR